MDLLNAAILGLIEGFSEFLPISSTGHLILVSHFLDLEQNNEHRAFEVIIQLGSILAVLVVLWRRLLGLDFISANSYKQSKTAIESKFKIFKNPQIYALFALYSRLFVAFLPAAIFGFLFYKSIQELFNAQIVAFMLIFVGVIFIIIEIFIVKKREKNAKNSEAKVIESTFIESTSQLPSYTKAIIIGVFQAFAMIPGTSRSGASIIGGLLCGLDRKSATEFSFMLALPTMLAATAYTIFKNPQILAGEQFSVLCVGFLVAFISAFFAVKVFLSFISRFNFIPFGIYRIALGCVFLAIL